MGCREKMVLNDEGDVITGWDSKTGCERVNREEGGGGSREREMEMDGGCGHGSVCLSIHI